MNKSEVLQLKSTLLLQSITWISLALISISIALFISISQSPEMTGAGAGIILTVGVISFFTFLMRKESIEEKNISAMISWAQNVYGVTVNRKQAIELVRYGNAEFGSQNHMIQLCLVERNGNFSLHKTQEIKIIKELE